MNKQTKQVNIKKINFYLLLIPKEKHKLTNKQNCCSAGSRSVNKETEDIFITQHTTIIHPYKHFPPEGTAQNEFSNEQSTDQNIEPTLRK